MSKFEQENLGSLQRNWIQFLNPDFFHWTTPCLRARGEKGRNTKLQEREIASKWKWWEGTEDSLTYLTLFTYLPYSLNSCCLKLHFCYRSWEGACNLTCWSQLHLGIFIFLLGRNHIKKAPLCLQYNRGGVTVGHRMVSITASRHGALQHSSMKTFSGHLGLLNGLTSISV